MTYLQDTEYAARNLIDLAMVEEREIDELWPILQEAEAKLRAFQRDFESSDLHDDFSDQYVMAAFHRMARAQKELDPLRSKVDELRASMGAKQYAVRSICGALLQIAKQGISLVHGSRNAAPKGRLVGGRALRDVIWEARNQAVHCEEGSFNASVTGLFGDLERAFGRKFDLSAHPQMSLAAEVVRVLGWQDYDQYTRDLGALGL